MRTIPDYEPAGERELSPVRRVRVTIYASRSVKLLLASTYAQKTLTAKLWFVIIVERTTRKGVGDLEVRIREGDGCKCSRYSGPGQFHATLNFGSYLKRARGSQWW